VIKPLETLAVQTIAKRWMAGIALVETRLKEILVQRYVAMGRTTMEIPVMMATLLQMTAAQLPVKSRLFGPAQADHLRAKIPAMTSVEMISLLKGTLMVTAMMETLQSMMGAHLTAILRTVGNAAEGLSLREIHAQRIVVTARI